MPIGPSRLIGIATTCRRRAHIQALLLALSVCSTLQCHPHRVQEHVSMHGPAQATYLHRRTSGDLQNRTQKCPSIIQRLVTLAPSAPSGSSQGCNGTPRYSRSFRSAASLGSSCPNRPGCLNPRFCPRPPDPRQPLVGATGRACVNGARAQCLVDRPCPNMPYPHARVEP